MKSFYGFMVLAFMFLTVFTGMLFIVGDLGGSDRIVQLSNDSNSLIVTLETGIQNVSTDNLGVDKVSIGSQDIDAFSAEFYSATTDSNKKQGTLDIVKNMPDLVRFTVGQESSFSWFWDIVIWFIVVVIGLVGFVMIFQRDVFGGNR